MSEKHFNPEKCPELEIKGALQIRIYCLNIDQRGREKKILSIVYQTVDYFDCDMSGNVAKQVKCRPRRCLIHRHQRRKETRNIPVDEATNYHVV